MKLKKLKKKIQQLEKRLREGPQKLAKLKGKLQQAETAKALKAARKSGSKPSPSTGAKKPSRAKKAKRKLNLSPEGRARLAAAMKARWAAKRAAEASAKSTSSDDQHAAPGPTPQPPESRPDGG